jgi:PIN domain nuclease of toxin-antitoxin system
MSLLLDTHTLLWWLSDAPTLSTEARESIGDPNRVVFVSAVTAWEISIKRANGRLEAPSNLSVELVSAAFQELPISVAHVTVAGQLPGHHRDSFDRLLVAQAQIENLTLVTRDKDIAKYDVATLIA